jgi:DNA modification methylase
VACINLDRYFIGIEKDATNFDAARRRIEQRRDQEMQIMMEGIAV